jgi:DNA-binding NtrC family response regulator
VLHDGRLVEPHMLPAEIAPGPLQMPANDVVAPQPPQAGGHGAGAIAPLVGTPLAEVERELIEATIAHCDGSVPRAARILEVSPSTLYRKLESWNSAQRRSGT